MMYPKKYINMLLQEIKEVVYESFEEECGEHFTHQYLARINLINSLSKEAVNIANSHLINNNLNNTGVKNENI